jgi:hypothetical protein
MSELTLPSPNPGLPSFPNPYFQDNSFVRGDQQRANNGFIWNNLEYLANNLTAKTITLADDAQININAIFDTARDGEYLIMWDIDPLTWGRIHYTQGSPSNATIVDGSANFVSGDVDTNLCLVQVVDDIFLKNRLGDEYDFIVYRRGV